MAADMRTKAYPPLPPKGSPRLAIVLPTTGDLRVRSLLPEPFQQQLVIHADKTHYLMYSQFIVLRKFIVMSSEGDLYTQTVRTSLGFSDLPQQRLLPLPSISPWDIVKVLDLVQCYTVNARWELVRVRWSSGAETWLPIDLLQRNFANLLQMFYVNSINSWAFRDRIYERSVREHKTEVELWLHHPEFAKFYQYLRRKRVMVAMGGHTHAANRISTPPANYQVGHGSSHNHPPTSRGSLVQNFSTYQSSTQQVEEDVKHVLHRSTRQSEAPRAASYSQSTPNRAIPQIETARAVSLPLPPPPYIGRAQHQSEGASHSTNTQQRAVGREIERDLGLQNTPRVSEAVRPVQRQEPEKPTESRAGVQSRKEQNISGRETGGQERPVPGDGRPSPLRIRKRLIRFQSSGDNDGEEDDADDIPLATLAKPSKSKHPAIDGASTKSSGGSSGPGGSSKKLKRLRKRQPGEDGSDSDSDVMLEVQPPTKAAKRRTGSSLTESTTETAPSGGGPSEQSPETTIAADDGEEEEDDDDDLAETSQVAPLVIGEIRCICGAYAVGAYAGKWLHCWNDECGVWEHAECVGMLYSEDDRDANYVCSKCDATTYRARLERAKEKKVDWMFQCCDSKNSVQLLKLLRESAGQASESGWRHPQQQKMTLLMKAARQGMVNCARHLIQVMKVDVFAADALGLNVLHHAVLGGKPRCVRFLLKVEPKLLEYQDRKGRTPFHCMLQSSALNDICVPLLAENRSLAVVGDLESNFPVHYALRTITKSTVEICRMILQVQPSTMREKSSDGFWPFILLCRAASLGSSRMSPTDVSDCAKQVIQMMLDIDILGTFLNERAPNGWTGLHFATASGNHELVSYLCSVDSADLDATTSDGLETALHIAAKGNFHLCVRALMEKGLRETAKDSKGWIPILYAEKPCCIQEFLHWKLTKQLSRLNRMTLKFEQKEVVQQWKRRVVQDPICFDMINDWCHCDLERVERMDGIFLRSPFVLRLDNKLDYLSHFVFPAIKECRGNTGDVLEKDGASRRKVIKFIFSTSMDCYWRQFVRMGKQLEPEDFRGPVRFSIDRSADVKAGSDEEVSLKVVLIRLAGALSAAEPGLLIKKDYLGSELPAQPHSRKDETERLLGFYLLGELVAHLVLYNVSLSGILDFSPSFLRCAFGQEENGAEDERWVLYGRGFAGGFDHVIPSALEILRPDEFRVLLNGRSAMLNACAVNWDTAMDWSSDPHGMRTKSWWSRFMTELVIEEQQLVLLLLAETLQAANQTFFVANGTTTSEEAIIVQKYPQVDDDDDDDDIVDEEKVLESDLLMPFMDYDAHTLNLPRYSCYSALKSAMLRLIRCSDQAFLRR